MSRLQDLFALASGNGPALARRYEDLLAGAEETHAEALSAFADMVADQGRVAVNLRLETAVKYLKEGKLLNVHEWAANASRAAGRDAEELLRQKLGPWYGKRVGFDDRFVDGRRFRYGSLNAGGLGPHRYGICCALTEERFLDGRNRLAFVEDDSLVYFVDDEGGVRMEALETALAPAGHHQHLAASKHAGDCEHVAPDAWPREFCRDDRYVEAIFVSELPPHEELAALRFPRREYDTIQEIVGQEIAGDPIRREDGKLLSDFKELLVALDNAGVRLEIIDHA